MIQKLIWEPFSFFFAVKQSSCNSLIYFLMLYQTNNAGEGTGSAKFCSALQHRAWNQMTQKRGEANFCNLESSKAAVQWVFAKLLAAGISPWEIHWQSWGGDPKHFTSPSQHFVISGVSKSLSSMEQPFDSVHHLILNIKLINITC